MAKGKVSKVEMQSFLDKQLDLLSKENGKIAAAIPEGADEERMKRNTLDRIERDCKMNCAI